MTCNSDLNVTIIGGLIVAAVAIFVFTPISELIFNNNSNSGSEIRIDSFIAKPTNKQIAIDTNKSHAIIKVEKYTLGEKTVIPPQLVNYSSFINTSIIKIKDHTNISVIVVDEEGMILSSISSLIANIYKQVGLNANIGLLKSSFTKEPQFQELIEGNNSIIEKLKLSNYTDYLVIGRIGFSMRSGTVINGTIICNVFLNVTIINATNNSIADSFTISDVIANGATSLQAKERAIQKLINNYSNEHSTL